MFQTLTAQIGNDPTPLFRLHPEQIIRIAEQVWFQIEQTNPLSSARPGPIGGSFLPDPQLPGGLIVNLPAITKSDHLIYAYMIENTRIVEIFQRVLLAYLMGEKLEVPSPETRLWLRTTESMFFRDGGPFSTWSLTSWLRPDIRSVRRNAYYRFFGMDLNHGTDANAPYPYEKPEAANREFVPTFEELLREVWIGIENDGNISGARPTDAAAIANYARRLSDMLLVRRRQGNLLREEFVFVAAMSWFHMTISYDSPVVIDLKSQASSPDERLIKIGERVGLPPHSKSQSYLLMAQPMSSILLSLEAKQFVDTATAPALYTAAPPPSPRDDMMTLVNQWSIATGRDMKARTVAPSARTFVMARNNGVAARNGVAAPS
jgi:hypothetical protein